MIHIVLGTKAQLVKMAPIMIGLQKIPIGYNFIFTGQHRATISEMLKDFGLKCPDIELYAGRDVVSLPQMFAWSMRILMSCLTSRALIFKNDRNGIVLVHGDTFSTVLGALMGKIAGFKVGHVESGLRSFNIFHPFPEELTRLVTFKLSDVLFCPGEWSVKNMRKYQDRKEIINTGMNTMLDTLELALSASRSRDHLPPYQYAIVSLHRYENIFKKKAFLQLIEIIERTAETIPLLFILHPPTEKQLKRFNLYSRLATNKNIELRPRYSYFAFVTLLEHTEFIITDGGSIQEESSYLGIPCLLLRHATERQEGLQGNVVLSEFKEEKITTFVGEYHKLRGKTNISGYQPSQVIIDSIIKYA